MNHILASIEYTHWMMVAGGLLVVLGVLGLVTSRERVEAEADATSDERDIVTLHEEDADPPVKQKRRDRWAERELILKESSDNGPEFYGKRSG